MSTDFIRKNRQYRTKPQQDEKIVINAEAYEQPERSVYLCDYCNLVLSSLNEEEYWCSRCSISFIPNEDTRMTNKLETPEGPDHETCVSYTPEPPDLMRKPLEIKGSLKAMKDKGLHITSYTETTSKGTRSWKEESRSSSRINKKGKGAPRPIGNTWE